ncbi:hypothetical protein CCR85_12760 [Rhodothalassium salexigens]|uniref:Uncharacterized protein DUF3775 n=1 Tax=Rhodothalassium salexigens DSM 2132 TaxID=1188247 RepID=A0A4V2SQ68_RHOSA|nr:DUF3775 domain-containing protein [Rhodothalassium salexigens]MBB4210597.1 hypothetical protein [Rhodothalassium salexigens DSM 2132]MBK1639719.1 hypothetical protein [Rhodothalassium salexigens DSM 2132]MBK5912357.1 hypothetical protein [Rhodothalassium salexigens]MBK5921487.1 hypothetical protein [Rhodothalassium salexigens]TCP37846.1 uncharacterized protein DUF3775 [Rhodothalassium salexigens DSM 2132]
MLTVPTDDINRLIVLARDYEAQFISAGQGLDSGDDTGGEATRKSPYPTPEADLLEAAIDDMSEEQQAQLVALVWIGRGTFEPEEWDDAVRTAREEAIHSTSEYLMGTPLLADQLVNGLDALTE